VGLIPFIRPAYFQHLAKIHVLSHPCLVVIVNRTVLSSLINYNKYVIIRLSALIKPARPLHPGPDLHAYLCDPFEPDQGSHPEQHRGPRGQAAGTRPLEDLSLVAEDAD